MAKKNDIKFGLLTFIDNANFEVFKNDIDNLLKKGNYINDNINYSFNDDICICNIYKKEKPRWVKNVVYKNMNKNKNHTHHRIILIQYSANIYYFEKNGIINVNDILNKYSFDLFVKTKWNNLFDKNMSFKELINNYLINELKNTDNVNDINQLLKENNFENIDFQNINTYEKIYNDIPQLQEDLKLIPYDYKTCIQKCKKNDKQSETMYNKNICENNDKYILLDCKYSNSEGIEVADIYDKLNHLFFHNKKSGDLRCLGFQTILGALTLKTKDKCGNYFEKLNKDGIDYTQIDTEKFKFAVGIIQMTKTINYKDKITLGIVYYHLKKMNIEFYIDKIDVINKTEPKPEPKNKYNSKSKLK